MFQESNNFSEQMKLTIMILLIVILFSILLYKIYNYSNEVKESFYASSVYNNINKLDTNIKKIESDVNDIEFKQDINKGTTEKNKSAIDKTIKGIKVLDKNVSKNINEIKQKQQIHENKIKNTEKTNLILDNMLQEDGDIPSQGRMLNNIIDSGNVERRNWSRDFYDLKQKQDNDQIKNQNILNELLKERKDLKNLVKDSQQRISEQTNKFTEGINKLGEFHDNYQKELESILKRKYNLSQDSFDLNEKIQESRIKKLNKELEEINILKKKVTGIEDNESRSIKCIGSGDKLNIQPVEIMGNPTGKYVVFLNDGCLNFKKSTVYGTSPCELSDLQQHFVINEIKDYKEYNKFIDKVNDGTKEFVFESDKVIYPFKIISPLEREGECLTISEEGVSIEPIINSPNQRFISSLIPNTSNCKSRFE